MAYAVGEAPNPSPAPGTNAHVARLCYVWYVWGWALGPILKQTSRLATSRLPTSGSKGWVLPWTSTVTAGTSGPWVIASSRQLHRLTERMLGHPLRVLPTVDHSMTHGIAHTPQEHEKCARVGCLLVSTNVNKLVLARNVKTYLSVMSRFDSQARTSS